MTIFFKVPIKNKLLNIGPIKVEHRFQMQIRYCKLSCCSLTLSCYISLILLRIFGVQISLALTYFFIEQLLTLCVFLWIRKRNFLELSDLCELESGVNIEKYQ